MIIKTVEDLIEELSKFDKSFLVSVVMKDVDLTPDNVRKRTFKDFESEDIIDFKENKEKGVLTISLEHKF